MKIATFNLRNFFDEGPRMDYGKEIVITKEYSDSVVLELEKTINSFAPDILIAQEVGSNELFNKIAKAQNQINQTFVASPDARGIANAVFFSTGGEASSLRDITNIPVMEAGKIDTLGETLLPYRNFVSLRTEYNGKPLILIGVHIKTTSGISLRKSDGTTQKPTTQQEISDAIARALIYRTSQALRLRELVDEEFKKDPKAQVIILGDFNALDGTELLRIIEGDKIFPESKLENLSETISKEKRFSFAGYKSKRQLDHILVSKSLLGSIKKFEILNEGLEDQTLFPDIVYTKSDHAALVLTLV